MPDTAVATDITEVQVIMSEEEARKAVTAIKRHHGKMYDLILDCYERQAHVALNYQTWGVFIAREFEQSRWSVYRLLDSAQAAKAVADPAFTAIASKRIAAPITSELRQNPVAQRAAWDAAKTAAGERPMTAGHVAAAVATVKANQPPARDFKPIAKPTGKNGAKKPPVRVRDLEAIAAFRALYQAARTLLQYDAEPVCYQLQSDEFNRCVEIVERVSNWIQLASERRGELEPAVRTGGGDDW